MKRLVLTTVCALAVTAVLWGCGDGADTRKEDSVEDTDMQGGEGTETRQGENDGVLAEGSAGNMQGGKAAADGVTFSIIGDSISTYQGYNPEGYYAYFPDNGQVADVADTWWQQVADDPGFTLYVNGSCSGATVVGDSMGLENPQCGCNELRTNGLSGPEGTLPDRIVIYLGTNDVVNSIPLGDNDGSRLVEEGVVEKFSDAYTLMLDKVQANYPQAEIYCCTLLPVGDHGTETPYVEFVNDLQLTSADYVEVITRIAKTKGMTVIDLNDCGVTIENLDEMTSDGVHPTAAGMRCIAEAVKEAFAGQAR